MAALDAEMEGFRGTLATDEVPVFDELLELVHAKGDVDFHRSLQGALKLWLFVHLPLSLVLLLLIAVHVVVVHAFGAAG